MAASGVCTCASHAITVLFVDDDADCRFAYELVATEAGMTVELAGDGHEAMAIAGAVLPDVVVLDVGLRSPNGLDGVNGLEVARRLRSNPSTSAIPIVFLSGHSNERDVAAMLACGCEAHLVKPCPAETLLGLVTGLAMRRRDEMRMSSGDARASST
jgi:CheY-like chemotaxis protein